MTNDVLKQIWPEWEIEENPLGKGSFGVVYKAVRSDHNVKSYAAIKVISIPSDPSEVDSLRSEGLDIDATKTFLQSIVDDFVNEIQLMESLKGAQNIVSIEDYKVVEKINELGWDIYIRMELLVPFNTYISDKKLTEKEVIKLGCDICTALEICAKRNIIHRDIKLENIFVSGFGDFKLGDFGVARTLENVTGGLSQKGAPNYMAPEVALGEKYDSRVDIYSLGIVLYRLLNANRLPFLDTERQLLNYAERKNAIERRLRGEAFNAPRDASLEMADVILRACAYDPNKRFSSATEMKQALMSVANGTYQVIGASAPDGTISVHIIPAVSDKQADEPISSEIVASEPNDTISVHRIYAAPDQQVDEPASSVVESSDPDGTISVRKVLETSDRQTERKVNTFGSVSNDDKNKRKKLKKIIAIASAAGAACVALVLAIVLLPKIINRPALEVVNGDVSSTSEDVSSSTASGSSSAPASSSTTTTTSISSKSSSTSTPPIVPVEPEETSVMVYGVEYDIATTTELVIANDDIPGTPPLDDYAIKNLWKLKNLKKLQLGVPFLGNSITSLSGIENLQNLDELIVYHSDIHDITPLAKLTNLKRLTLRSDSTYISDFTPIGKLTNLTFLQLHVETLDDLSPFANLTNLTELALWSGNPPLNSEDVDALRKKLPNCTIYG